MTNQEIRDSIRAWSNIRDNSASLIGCFEQGNAFTFLLPSTATPSDVVHIYPAVFNEKLIFISILAQYDKPQYGSSIENFVEVSPVFWGLMNTRIPETEAKERMTRWNNDFRGWTQNQINTTYGIFSAFRVSAEDFEVPEVQVNLALKRTSLDPFVPSTADLIVINKLDGKILYDDFAEPVPPYNSLMPEQDFSLLQF